MDEEKREPSNLGKGIPSWVITVLFSFIIIIIIAALAAMCFSNNGDDGLPTATGELVSDAVSKATNVNVPAIPK